MNDEVQFLRARDVATRLGVSTARVYQFIRAGRIPVVREGRAVLIPRQAWERWLDMRADEALSAMQLPRA